MKSAKKTRRNTAAPVIDLAARHRQSRVEPRLPHERDEGVGPPAAQPRGLIRRAYRDLASGQVDTDCRNSAADIIRKKSTGRRRQP
jgi:hypothetical protein